jgi:predicted transcriptional regulator
MSGDAEKDQRFLSIKWRNGEESLLQVYTKTFNRLMEAMYGRVPKEQTDEAEETGRKKSRIPVILFAVILIGVIVKFFVLN